MSAFLRANKTRRVRSLSSGSSSSTCSLKPEHTGGVPVTTPSDDGSPQGPKVRFSALTQEIGRMTLSSSTASSIVSGGSAREPIQSSPFQIGNAPADDVFSFSASPNKRDHVVPAKSPFLKNTTSLSPIKDTEERRITRAVTTGNALVPGTPGNRTFSARNARHQIGGVDVQGIYPPSACVFVANLPEARDDRALEAAVTREFSRYGTVFVKIRRDGNRMPFAFCQYTNDNDAKVAMEEGRGAMIFGRPCRTEKVKANRTFVIYKRDGSKTTVGVARAILEPYGELSRCELLNAHLQEVMRLPQAVLVEFARFDPKRDINSAVREHDGFCIDAFDVKKKNLIARVDADEDFLRKYDIDRRSVFVGDLPCDAEKEELVEIFSEVGDVANVDVIKRMNDGVTVRAFAFVEFTRADIPDHAVERFNNFAIRGSYLKVERKVFKHVNTPRRVKSQAFSIKSSTTPKTPRFAATSAQSAAPSVEKSPAVTSPAYFVCPPSELAPAAGPSGLPVSPSAAPYGMASFNAYNYAGGYWPGFSSYQDPALGDFTYYSYTPRGEPSAAAPSVETPTRERKHHFGA